MNKKMNKTIIVAVVTILLSPSNSRAAEPLTTYQGCVVCTAKGNTFQVNMKNQEVKCSKSIWSNTDSVEVTEEKKCEIFNRPVCHHPSQHHRQSLLPNNATRLSDGQQDTLTVACHCAACPMTVPVTTERVTLTLTLFQQCVLCTESQRHFRVNLKTHDTNCYESAQQTSDAVVVSKIASCQVLRRPCVSSET